MGETRHLAAAVPVGMVIMCLMCGPFQATRKPEAGPEKTAAAAAVSSRQGSVSVTTYRELLLQAGGGGGGHTRLVSVNRPADFQYSVSRGDIPPADFDSLLTENTIWNVARIA